MTRPLTASSPTRLGVELEEALFGRTCQDALAFEGAADALRQPLDERLQLLLTRRRNAPEHGWFGIDGRIIDVVCDSAGADAVAVAAIDVAGLKRRAFDLVLRAEEPHLKRVGALKERLRAELVETGE